MSRQQKYRKTKGKRDEKGKTKRKRNHLRRLSGKSEKGEGKQNESKKMRVERRY